MNIKSLQQFYHPECLLAPKKRVRFAISENLVVQALCKWQNKRVNSLQSNKLTLQKVRAKGLEPIRTKALDPKSSLATNYNTPAIAFALQPGSGPDSLRCKYNKKF